MSRSNSIWINLDWLTVIIFMVMLLIGWVSIYSSVYDETHSSIFDTSQRYGKQLIWIIAALVIAFAIMLTDIKLFLFFSYFFYGFTILLLLAVLFFGTEVNASKSWFQFGGIQIQPAEFAKMATALAIAQYLSNTKQKIHDAEVLFKSSAIILLPVMLILLQPDVGSSLVFFSFLLVLYREGLNGWVLLFFFLLGVLSVLALLMTETAMLGMLLLTSFAVLALIVRNFKLTARGLLIFALVSGAVTGIYRLFSPDTLIDIQLIVAAASGTLVLLIITLIGRVSNAPVVLGFLFTAIIYTYSVDYVFDNVLMPHQKSRINIVLGFEDDPMGQSYNINQSKIAIGSGGLTGKGFLQGTQTKFNFVPEQSTDFIFCTIGEEWGFVGSVVLLALFVIFLLRLLIIAERQRSSFARIYGYSVIAIFFTHLVINIGMTIGVVPVIGIPLPFISYGGSSMWAFTLMLFILLKFDAGRMEYMK
ncbi:MAG: rod shape-determining protein RodA [Marinilabiliales bacterium]|nr:MAG: rod shape-determining protein RodA [Marinilabiliales bacterium]